MVTKKVIGLLFFLVDAAIAFSIGSHRNKALALQFTTQPSQLYATPQAQETPTQLDTPIALGSYTHKNRKLTYLFKEAAPGRENEPPIILIHPVGVGISSWFWMRLMEAYEDNPAIYAPDLIGCGLNHGADPWDPEKVCTQNDHNDFLWKTFSCTLIFLAHAIITWFVHHNKRVVCFSLSVGSRELRL